MTVWGNATYISLKHIYYLVLVGRYSHFVESLIKLEPYGRAIEHLLIVFFLELHQNNYIMGSDIC